MRKEIRFCGFGGQGIILAGVVFGEAAVRAGHWAVQTQSYGPESRGGAARSEVVIASAPIDYPRVTCADAVVALSQTAFDKYTGDLREGAIVVVDGDLVEAGGVGIAAPFTTTAEKVGHKIVTNIVMIGYLRAMLDIFPLAVLEETVLAKVPKGTEEMNRMAILAGQELYAKHTA